MEMNVVTDHIKLLILRCLTMYLSLENVKTT